MPSSPDRPKRETARLLLLCHGATPATRRAAFPLDESVEPEALVATAVLAASLPASTRVLVSPMPCARQTAAALGLTATEEPALRDCDWGRWRGRTLDEVAATEPDAASSWLADPAVAPHGGELLAALIGRVGAWMDRGDVSGRVLAVTHPAVIRAALLHALGAQAACFWHIDVAPLTIVELGRNSTRWSVRAGRASPP